MQIHVTLTAVYLIQELSILRVFSIVKNDLVSLEKTPPVVITKLMKSMLLYDLCNASYGSSRIA